MCVPPPPCSIHAPLFQLIGEESIQDVLDEKAGGLPGVGSEGPPAQQEAIPVQRQLEPAPHGL